MKIEFDIEELKNLQLRFKNVVENYNKADIENSVEYKYANLFLKTYEQLNHSLNLFIVIFTALSTQTFEDRDKCLSIMEFNQELYKLCKQLKTND